jgi:hypothetical protein
MLRFVSDFTDWCRVGDWHVINGLSVSCSFELLIDFCNFRNENNSLSVSRF